MSEWIKEAAARQRERDKEIAAIVKAGRSFLESLLQQVKADIVAFNMEFPRIRAGAGIDFDGSLKVTAGNLAARVKLDPKNKYLRFTFPNGSRPNTDLPLTLTGDGSLAIETDGEPLDMNTISEFFLRPVLFPDLCTGLMDGEDNQ